MTSRIFADKRSDLPLSKGFANSLDDFFCGRGSSTSKEFCNHLFHLSKLHDLLASRRRTPCRAVLKWANNSCHFGGDKREHQQSEERSSDWLPSPLPSHWSREDGQVTASQLWEARGDNQVKAEIRTHIALQTREALIKQAPIFFSFFFYIWCHEVLFLYAFHK